MEKAIDKMAKDIFCDFITIAIHNLLHSRQVYPSGAFKLRQKFNVPVQVCYHPDVFSYITNITDNISQILKTRKLHAIHIFIGTAQSDWEQITLKLHAFSSITTQDELSSLQSSLKTCLLKLSIIDTYLPRRVTSDITWRVEVDADEQEMELSNGTNWTKKDCSNIDNQLIQAPANSSRNVVPLKTVATDVLKLEMVVVKL